MARTCTKVLLFAVALLSDCLLVQFNSFYWHYAPILSATSELSTVSRLSNGLLWITAAFLATAEIIPAKLKDFFADYTFYIFKNFSAAPIAIINLILKNHIVLRDCYL